MKKKVLIIDDDLITCNEIKNALQSHTTEVYCAVSAGDGLEQLAKQQFCLVIMDILLSEADGISLLQTIRRIKPIPILVLASDSKQCGKVSVLNAGADSYMDKPFKLEECLAQAQSLMRLYMELHGTAQRCYTLAFGLDLIIDPVRHQATLKGDPLDLTRKEFDLLFCLALHAGQVLSRDQLYSHVWPNDNEFDVEASIKNHIKKLRKKLSTGGKDYIKNIWGVGYYFTADDENDK